MIRSAARLKNEMRQSLLTVKTPSATLSRMAEPIPDSEAPRFRGPFTVSSPLGHQARPNAADARVYAILWRSGGCPSEVFDG